MTCETWQQQNLGDEPPILESMTIESPKSRIRPAAIVSLIARTALHSDDDNIPDEVLDDLIGRFRVRDE
jgi:hypothetical protein